MGRNRKIGLDYFPMDVDFFSDIRIRKLIKYQGGRAITVYALLLCLIYKCGYYMRWDEELPFVISEQTGFDEAYILEVLKCCMVVGLFDKDLFDTEKVITSKGIQIRYKDICDSLRRVCRLDEYCLISSEENGISSEEKSISSEEKAVSSEEKPINSAKSTQKKRKGNKLYTPTPPKQGDSRENRDSSRIEGSTIQGKARVMFEDYYRDLFGNVYYWTAKDAGGMKQLLKKIEFNRSQKDPPLPNDEKSLLDALLALLRSIKDGWVYEHFSVTNINSQFNEIVANAKTRQYGKQASTDRSFGKRAEKLAQKIMSIDGN